MVQHDASKLVFLFFWFYITLQVQIEPGPAGNRGVAGALNCKV